VGDHEEFERVGKKPFLLAYSLGSYLEEFLSRPPSHFMGHPMFFGPLLGEGLVRLWLGEKWEKVEKYKDKFIADSEYGNSYHSLFEAFEDSRKFRKGLAYVSDRPKLDEELLRNHPKNYFQQRILDFLNCDGIALAVHSDSDDSSAIPLPFKLEPHAEGLIDRDNEKIDSTEWIEYIESSGQFLEIEGAMQIFASFDERSPELKGNSFLLSLASAIWRKKGRLNLHPLELGITGGLNSMTRKIEMVRSLEAKFRGASEHRAFLFVAPSPESSVSEEPAAEEEKSEEPAAEEEPTAEEEPAEEAKSEETAAEEAPGENAKSEELMTWIDVQNSVLGAALKKINQETDRIWMNRAGKLLLSAGENHSAVSFKLVYDLDLPEDWNEVSLNGFRVVEEGEGAHLSKFRINHLSSVFSENLFFRKDTLGREIPCVFELDLDLLKSLDTLRVDTADSTTKWAKLTGIDLIPFKVKCVKGEDRVPFAKLGFIFKTLKGATVNFADYQKFITQRRFGKIPLCRNKEKDHSRRISISQIICEIQKMIFRSRNFNFEELLCTKPKDENQPQVIQYLLSPEEVGAFGNDFWKELTGRPDFKKAFELISALSDVNRSVPKTECRIFEMEEAVFTQYALHHRALTAWSHSADPFNRENKPGLFTRAFSFISLLAQIAKEVGLDENTCQNVFEDVVKTRKGFFRQCMNYYLSDE
jgi:hypothetical protein